jgi:hypothetical protein
VETWTYQNINSVFHNPDTLELSHEEKIELAKKQKIIKHDNTRLTKMPWKTDKQVRSHVRTIVSGIIKVWIPTCQFFRRNSIGTIYSN